MKAEIEVLKSRIGKMEKCIESLVRVVMDTKEFEDRDFGSEEKLLEEAFDNLSPNSDRMPFNPDCIFCEKELIVVLEGTAFEYLYCPECESWFFTS